MNRFASSILISGLMAISVFAQPSALQTSAEQFVDCMVKGDFAAAVKDFDAAMTQAMPSPLLKQTWETLIAQCGPFQKRQGFRTEKYQQYDITYVTCQFEKLALDAKIVFDSSGKISGLFFVPAQAVVAAKQVSDAGSSAQPPSLQIRAEQFIDLMTKGDYAAAVGDFDPTMTQAMPAPLLKQTWETLVSQCGAFAKREGFRTEKFQQYDITYVTCQFEKVALDAKIVFDPSGKISGLFFVPAQTAAAIKQDSKPIPLPDYIKPDAFTEKEITFGKDPWILPGTLTIPKGNGPFAAIVLVHGSGPNDRDETLGPNKPFKDLAQGLATKGIIVFRYDKRTFHYRSQLAKDVNDLTVRQETIEDAAAAVDFLAANPQINKHRIFVLGHSMGGMLIPRIAAENKTTAGFVIMAGSICPLEDSVLEQCKYIAMLDGKIDPEERKALAGIQKQVEMVKSPSLTKETPRDQIFNAPAGYWLDLRGYKPAVEAKAITQPILILQGQREYQVTMEDFEGWKKELSGKPNVEFKLYPDLNHFFITGKEKCRPEEYLTTPGHVAGEVIDDIAVWINKAK